MGAAYIRFYAGEGQEDYILIINWEGTFGLNHLISDIPEMLGELLAITELP